jgi:hypothetical protein
MARTVRGSHHGLEERFLAQGGGSVRAQLACGVSVVDWEDADGKKLIDDGVSTVAALTRCLAKFELNEEMTPEGNKGDASNMFNAGLRQVRTYVDDE